MGDEGPNSGTATGAHFDVFLSFRGPDTRNTFTDCLYEYMNRTGIRIFRDEEALGPGKNISEILGAVERSQIYIPILSQGYASSRWCLRELTCMVECTCRSMGKEILPIFYDVEPLDVKLETELYKSFLREHEKDLGCTQVKPWKEALTTVARIKGWCLKGQRHGKVIADITEKVLRKVTIGKRYLPTNLVGIDDHVEAIKKLLSCDTGGVRFVIIHGIGGIGKTTLAETVFNQLSPQFEGHSFLLNIRESSSCCGIVKMQRKLVEDLIGFSLRETIDREEGNNRIKEILPNKRVLLVLDDMDEKDQFVNLAMNSYSYGPGSRIIITTRDFPMNNVDGLEENILTWSGQFFLYEMKEMHFDHALLLFNKLAFNTDSAPCDLYDLSRQVVELTGGLPLALQVIGSHLSTISKAKWKTTLTKLKEVPHKKVQERLKISYDALGYEGQQIFLDIACFFVNKKITNAMYMWEACSFYPEVEIDILIRKSLIKIDHDRIWMHDQLRDLGKEIVRQENIRNPGDRSRLWFLEMSQAKKGNVVALAPWNSRPNFTREDLMNTRFLKLDGGNFAGNCENILPGLRWLCWRNCPSQLQANNFVLNHLVVLKLSGNITTEEWSGWVEIMVASKLKVLKIAGSKSLIKTPCFSKFMSLERLVLKDFLSLVEIDRSIGQLQQLIYLKIKWCPCLRELPKEIGCLTALEELILIQGHSVCYLPESIGNIRGLSRLVMEDTGLVELPDTVKGLVDLKHLSLVNCTYLNSLPDALGELKSLTELDLSGTTIGNLPHLIWNLEDLTLRMKNFGIRTLVMKDLPMRGHSACHLPDLIGELRGLPRLSTEDTRSVELLETINGLRDLESLHLLNCVSLNSLSDAVGELRTPTELDLSGTTSGEISPSIWNLEDLDSWGIRSQLSRDLPIQGDSVCNLPNSIGSLRGLSRLVREEAGLAERLDRIRGLDDPEYLCLSNCPCLNSPADAVRGQKTLAKLDLSRINIKKIPIWNLEDLTLRINSCEIRRQQMRDLPLLEDEKDCLYPRRRRDLRSFCAELIREQDRGLGIRSFWAELLCKQNCGLDRRLVLQRQSFWADLICKHNSKRDHEQNRRLDLRSFWADLICKQGCERDCEQKRILDLWSFWANLLCKQDCKRDREQDLFSRWLRGGSNQIRLLCLMAFEVFGFI